MTLTLEDRAARRRRARRIAVLRWSAIVLGVAIVFAIGVAVGEAIHDNPKPGGTVTQVRTLNP